MVHSLSKYWPSVMNHLVFCVSDRKWSDAMIDFLKEVKDDKILFMCDDYWLDESVDSMLVMMIANKLKEDVKHIRLVPSGESEKEAFIRIRESDITLRKFLPTAEYFTSMNAGLWNRKHLLKLLVPNKDIWEFETEGRHQMKAEDIHLNVNKRILQYGANHEGGKFTKQAFEYFKRENLHEGNYI